jgi:hypothetical protein
MRVRGQSLLYGYHANITDIRLDTRLVMRSLAMGDALVLEYRS